MIKCERNNVELEGTQLTILAEFGMIAFSLRKALLHEFDAETVRKLMDAPYNFREEGETC